MKSKAVSSVFDIKYAPQLKCVFDFYTILEDPEINEEVSNTNFIIQQKGFLKFCEHFKIIPDILSESNITLIFEDVVKNKPAYGKADIKGLRYNDFLETILKICILGKYKLRGEQVPEEIATKFALVGIDAGLIEKLFAQIGITQGQNNEILSKKLKRIKQQTKKILKPKSSVPKFEKEINERLRLKDEIKYNSRENNKSKATSGKSNTVIKEGN